MGLSPNLLMVVASLSKALMEDQVKEAEELGLRDMQLGKSPREVNWSLPVNFLGAMCPVCYKRNGARC